MLSELETKPEPGPATDLAFYLIASDEIGNFLFFFFFGNLLLEPE